MTRTISLADDAYDSLAAVKRPGESFSDVARRLARNAALDALFDPAFRIDMTHDEAEAWTRSIYAARDSERGPRVRFP